MPTMDPRETATALTSMLERLEPMPWRGDPEGKRLVQHAIAAELIILNGCVQRKCVDCGQPFFLPAHQVEWHRVQQMHLPSRCLPCRRERRQQRAAADLRQDADLGI
jgi:hypothetical protein